MKITKRIYTLIALVLIAFSFNTYNMETQPTIIEQPTFQNYVDYIGNILLGNFRFNPEETSPLQQLAPEIQSKIAGFLLINDTTDSLKTCAQTISALAQVNKELNELINDPQFCLQLIKHLAKKFNCSDLKITKALQTKEAKRRLELQNQLYELCCLRLGFVSLKKLLPLESLIEQGVDLEFTYDTIKPNFFVTPLMLATATNNEMLNKLCAIVSKYFHINQYTPSLLWAIELRYIAHIKILLNAGADPELADSTGLTPLAAAQKTGNQEVIDLIQNTINKKHEKKS